MWNENPAGALAHGPDPLIGTVLAERYRLTTAIGEGGFGTVYRAETVSGGDDRPVAVKVIRPGDMVGWNERVARFRREASALAALRHPNVIAFHDFGPAEDGVFYMAMELVSGPTLRNVLEGGRALPPGRTGRILSQLLSALDAAHGAGMVHRDLKPENVMFDRDAGEPDFVKVVDFGLAKAFSGHETVKLTRTNMAYGTVHFMAPEQVTGGKVDPRTDLYAAGVLTYRMLSGKLPFDGVPGPVVMFHHVHQTVPHIRSDGATRSLKSVVYRALHKRPRDRFASAAEMLQALSKALADPEAVVEGGETPPAGLPLPS